MKSKLAAILTAKCPRCRKGSLFPVTLLSFRKLSAVNSTCPHCKVVLEPEPDFFYGAMYVSYALSVALFICVMVVLNFVFGDPGILVYISSVAGTNVLFLPLMLRYSKVLYLYAAGKIKFDPNLNQ
ncbi:DUF983 domain-containing protein [Echinicola jeungdonensis]|uniref:DUF983 domain-containing protein n=1 Tax=Echinicola jeungdonensis TaxID=709343 RepID=A0ABV5J492_9BACT